MAAIGKGLETYLHRQATEIALNHLAEAREQAAKIREQAELELVQVRHDYEQQSVRSNDQERRRSLARARLAVSHQLASNNEQALQQVWQLTKTALASIAKADIATRLAILVDLITDAAVQLEGGVLEFQVSAHDLILVTPDYIDMLFSHITPVCNIVSLHLNPQPAAIWGGVVVTRMDSSQVVDNSFANRLTLVQQELRNQVYALLESEPMPE